MPPKNNNRQSFRLFDILLLIIGLGFIAFSVLYLWDWYSHTQGLAPPPDIHRTVTFSTDTPDERPVSQDSAYNVPADQPKKIIIPSINTEGFIQPVGKDQHNQVGVPTNIHFAGWFVDSAKPGDSGLSIIDGHVSSRYGTALFAKLSSLHQNDIVQVQFGDDSIRVFQVIDQRDLIESKAASFLLTKRDDIDQQLNLITCGGRFNKKSDQYINRFIIVTKRIK